MDSEQKIEKAITYAEKSHDVALALASLLERNGEVDPTLLELGLREIIRSSLCCAEVLSLELGSAPPVELQPPENATQLYF